MAARLQGVPPGRIRDPKKHSDPPDRVLARVAPKILQHWGAGPFALSSDRRRSRVGFAESGIAELDSGTQEAGAESGHRVEPHGFGAVGSGVSHVGGR